MIYSGTLNEDELLQLYEKIGSVFDIGAEDADDE